MALIVTFLLYIIIIFKIAMVASRRTLTHRGFILADRQLGPWATALGAGASDMGGWLVMALPGAFFVSGLQAIWLPLGLTVGAYLNWLWVAKRLRTATAEYGDSQTIPSFFYHRFGGQSAAIKITSAIVILFFFTLYISSGFVSGAMLMQSTFGWNYQIGLLVGVIVIASYSCLGGFLAVNWIDIFQGLLMLFTFVLVAVLVTHTVGGIGVVHSYYQQQAPQFFHITPIDSVVACISSLGWGLGYFGQPHILVRFMGSKNTQVIALSRRICTVWMIGAMAAAAIIGIVGRVYFADKLSNPETVFLELIRVALNPWVAGLLFAAVLSAIMSTIAAQLIASCSVITEDLYNLLRQQPITDKEKLLFNRIILVIIAIIAAGLALDPKTSLLNLVGYAWAGFGAAFGPVVIMSLYNERLQGHAAAIGMCVGALVTIVWHVLGVHLGGIFALYELIPGFFANLLLLLVLSYSTGR